MLQQGRPVAVTDMWPSVFQFRFHTKGNVLVPVSLKKNFSYHSELPVIEYLAL